MVNFNLAYILDSEKCEVAFYLIAIYPN